MFLADPTRKKIMHFPLATELENKKTGGRVGVPGNVDSFFFCISTIYVCVCVCERETPPPFL